jgi:hypothetical protein
VTDGVLARSDLANGFSQVGDSSTRHAVLATHVIGIANHRKAVPVPHDGKLPLLTRGKARCTNDLGASQIPRGRPAQGRPAMRKSSAHCGRMCSKGNIPATSVSAYMPASRQSILRSNHRPGLSVSDQFKRRGLLQAASRIDRPSSGFANTYIAWRVGVYSSAVRCGTLLQLRPPFNPGI